MAVEAHAKERAHDVNLDGWRTSGVDLDSGRVVEAQAEEEQGTWHESRWWVHGGGAHGGGVRCTV
jgi:hypothetical protein